SSCFSHMYNTIAARPFPWIVPCVAVALMFIGWAAIERSEQLTDGSERLVRQQIVWSVVGLTVLAATSMTDYRWLARHTLTLYGAAIVALMAVYAFPAVNNAHRWIRVAGLGVQPSEFAKVIFILALSRLL